jgi:hypothetical protein
MVKLREIFGFNRHSYTIFSIFLLTCLLIVYIWWPLVVEYFSYYDGSLSWYYYVDWLLLGIFTFMSITIMARADLKTDSLIIFVGMCGGLVIESWGTQTNLWHYYTAERPPLWIIPAWPIASLSIDRITRAMDFLTDRIDSHFFTQKWINPAGKILYWFTFTSFILLMVWFVAPTLDKSYTIAALFISITLILSPHNQRKTFIIFTAGSGLGYFLERWGTTRECWTYYTNQTPPVFAIFAHGMAAVAFWRTGLLIQNIWGRLFKGNVSVSEKQ